MTATTGAEPTTYITYLFVRTGTTRKGQVIGYWKDGGRIVIIGGAPSFERIDMTPLGWDGRVRFAKPGDPPPEPGPPQDLQQDLQPQRPGDDAGEADGDSAQE